MARNFNGISDNLTTPSAVVTGPPFTISAWLNADLLHAGAIASLIDSSGVGSSTERFQLMARVDGVIRFQARDSGGQGDAETSTTYSSGVWNHACGIAKSATDRSAFLNGGGKGTNAISRVPLGLDETNIGMRNSDNFFNGRIGHVAIWNVDLTDQEVASLAAGISPLRIRPGNLIAPTGAYWPINGQSPEPSIMGGFPMTVTGTTVVEEPPIPQSIKAP